MRKKIITIFAIFLLTLGFLINPSPVSAAIAFDVAGTGSGTGTTVDVTGPTVGSGSNRVLIVGVAQGNSTATLTSVTWDQGGTNQAMTRIASQTEGTNTRIELWRLVAPTSGAKTLRVVSPSSVGMAIGIVSYTGVDQSTPNDTPPTGTTGAPGSTPSITVTSATNDLVVDAVGSKENLTNKTAGTNQTERAELGAGDEIVMLSEEAGASSVTMTWTGTFEEWAQVGASLNPSSSGFDVSGTFHGVSESGGDPGQCDGSTANLSLRVNGGTAITTTCTDSSGTFTFTGVSASAGDTITIYSTGADKANRVYVSDGSADSGMNIFEDTVIVADEQDGTVTILDLVDYDSTTNNTDMLFDAVDSATDTLTTESAIELHIWTGDTFDPGGTVTTTSEDLHIDDNATAEIDNSSSVIGRDVLVDGGATFRVNANVSVNGGDITTSGTSATVSTTSGTPTVTMSGTGSIGGGTTPSLTFYNLATTGTGTTTLSNAATINNNLAVGGTTAIFIVGASTTVTNDVTVAGGTTLRVNADLAINGGDITTSGTSATVTTTSGTPTVTMSGTGSIGGGTTPSLTFYNLATTGTGTTTLSNSTTINNNLAIGGTTAIFIASASTTVTNDVTVAGGTTLRINADMAVNGGDITTSGTSATVTTTSGTPTVTISGTGSIGGGTTPTLTFHNLNTTGSGTTTIANTTTVNNDISVGSGTTLTINASVTISGGDLTTTSTAIVNNTSGTPTVTTTGTGAIGGGSGSITIYNLTTNGSSTTTTISTNNIVISNALSVGANHTLAIGTNSLTIGSTSVSDSGDITMASGATTSQSASGTVTILGNSGNAGDWSGPGTFTAYNLTIGNGSTTFTIDNETSDLPIDVNNTFTVTTNATFQASSTGSFTVGNSWSNSASATFTANSSTVTFDATSGSPTIASGGDAFYNLTLNDAGNNITFALSDALDTNNNLTITGGTLNSNGNNITVGGNWTNDDIFTEGTATVTFDSATAATLDSNCTTVSTCTNENFYNLTINKTSSTDTVTLTNFGIRVTNTLTVTTGTLVQGTFNIRAEGTTAISVGANGNLSNTSTGDISLSGNVSNSGNITLKANGACGSTDEIAITAISGTPSWSGSGTFTLYDVSLTGQDAAVAIVVYSGTDGGSNTGSWTFSSSCPGSNSNATHKFTLSLWVNPNSSIATKALMVKNAEVRLVTDGSGNPLCQITNNSSWQTAVTSSTALSLNTWQHVACTYDQQNIKIYVNGVLTGSQSLTTTIDDTTNNWRFGNDQGGTYGDFNGKMDEVRIYNSPFSGGDVEKTYNLSLGPVGWWKMDEASWTNDCSTDTVFDSSGNGHNGDACPNSTGPTGGANGKYGKAGFFDGSNDYVSIADHANLDLTDDFTISVWFAREGGGNEVIFSKNSSGTSGGYALLTGSAGEVYCRTNNGSSNADSSTASGLVNADSTWHHIAAVRNGSSCRIYIDGIDKTSSVGTHTTLTANNDNLTIGDEPDLSDPAGGRIDDVKLYNYARTQAQVVEDLNANHPAPGSPVGSPVAYWKIDQGYGTNVDDSSENNNDLTMNTASWTTDGKFNKAWNGTGGAIRMSRSTDADLEFSASEDFSVSLWFKSDTTDNTGATEYLLADGGPSGSAGYAIYTPTDDTVCFGIDDDASWDPDVASCTSADVYDNTWHHVTAVRNVTLDKTLIYVDARVRDSDTDATTATLDSSPTFFIGDIDTDDAGSGEEFAGDIDEVKVFRLALTPEQVKTDYNRGQAVVYGALSTTSAGNVVSDSYSREFCIPGDTSTCNPPVAHWMMEEGSGTTTNDSSGNANNSSAFTGGVSWATGKFGKGLSFDGDDDVVRIVESSSTDIGATTDSYSVSAWFKTTFDSSQFMEVVGKRGGSTTYPIRFGLDTSERAHFELRHGATTSPSTGTTALNDGKWHHIAAVRNVSTDTHYLYVDGILVDSDTDVTTLTVVNNDDISIGNAGSAYVTQDFNGQIDDARIYNYARSGAQIAWEYNRGKPLGHWKLNEGQGTTANDSSGNGYTGTLTNSPTWASGTGKYHNGVTFGNSTNHITMGDVFAFELTTFTLSGWFYRTGTCGIFTQCSIISKGSNSSIGYSLNVNDDDGPYKAGIYLGDSNQRINGTSTINTNTWYHIAASINGTTVKIYVNGKLETSTAQTTTPTFGTESFKIGNANTNNDLPGQGTIDDARIYNYVLTDNQIKTLYNQDSAVRYGPITGTP